MISKNRRNLRITLRFFVVLILAVGAAACGGSTTSTASTVRAVTPVAEVKGAEVQRPPTSNWGVLGREPIRPREWTPIMVDQFGYLPTASKVAVLVDPQMGSNSSQSFAPGTTLEVRLITEGEMLGDVVYTGSPVPWRDGETDPQAGDKGWWFDFSEVDATGRYVVLDVDSGVLSHPFEIGPEVYDELLDVALRVFWYNRGNAEHATSLAGPWSGDATLIAPNQDTAARWVDDRENDATARDLSGGWYDAGDTNKYVTFATSPVHQLLGAYQATPDVFDDEVGIPESGNGVPDILDEVRWEVEWLEKMQDADGGVLLKVGNVDFNDAESIYDDVRPRFYEEACSSSSIAAAGMFAHAAVVFADIDPGWAEGLQERAVRAHNWYQSNEKRNWCDDQIVKAGDADLSVLEQEQLEVLAAVYLYELTSKQEYHQIIKAGLTITNPWKDGGFGRYEPEQALAISRYRLREDADPGLVAEIDARLTRLTTTTGVHGWDEDNSLYRSFMPNSQYHWGSNMVAANTGNANLALVDMGFDLNRDDEFLLRSSSQLATLHGVNPLGLVYLTNMGAFGGERSIAETYHYLYRDGSDFDSAATSAYGPAPGYLVGGPNSAYSGVQSPPGDQPLAKSYLDWNGSSVEDRSWEISEPAIYYQSAYVRLLSGVIGAYRG